MVPVIYSFIRWWIGSGIFDRIQDVVMEMMSSDLTNDEKRTYVITKILAEYDLLKVRVVDLVISIVLVKLKS